MAPVNGSGPSKGQARKPHVVPVVPLSYMPRQSKSTATKPATPMAPSQPEPSDAAATPKAIPKKPAAVSPALMQQPVMNGTPKADAPGSRETEKCANGTAPTESQSVEFPSVNASEQTSPSIDHPTATPSQSDSSSACSGDEMRPRDINGSGPNGTASRASNATPADASLPVNKLPSNMSTPGYRMPPPFYPGGKPHGTIQGFDSPRAPQLSRGSNNVQIHHPRPSNGHVQFGGFQGSNTSSPAPHSAGFAPPPVTASANGQASHMSHGPNVDYPPHSMAFVPEFDHQHPTSMDRYGQGMVGFAGHDGYMPYMGNFGPSTPHSFHGSQTSGHGDENGTFGQYSPPVQVANGHGDDGQARAHSNMMLGMPPPVRMVPPMPPHMMHEMPDLDAMELYNGMRTYFQDPKFSDCTLEMRFVDDRAPPVKMPAHRLVLAQSSSLGRLLKDTLPPSSTLTLNVADKYVRTDAFITALQRLYGFPLFTIPAPPPGSDGLPLAGDPMERFSFVLGYAASGHELGCRSVAVRGMELAAQLLSWDTLEKAVEFAIGSNEKLGIVDAREQWPYGDVTKILLDAIVNFIANKMPPKFSLDTSAADPKDYARLPFVPPAPKPAVAAHSPKQSGPPAIARGSMMRGGPRRPLSGRIKFGDLAPEDGSDCAAPKPAKRTHPALHTALSRVVLNLPFNCLKNLLENAPHVPNMESIDIRRLAADIIAEREARRLAAIEGIKAGTVDDVKPARDAMGAVMPDLTNKWTVLSFHESLAGGGSPLHIYRNWSPMMLDKEKMSPLSSPAYP